jgi:hypothetical protein
MRQTRCVIGWLPVVVALRLRTQRGLRADTLRPIPRGPTAEVHTSVRWLTAQTTSGRIVSSGMLRRVAFVRTDVSEELSACEEIPACVGC